jgi:hypothetical protein
MMDNGARAAAQHQRVQAHEPSRTHDDRRRVVAVGDLEDRLPYRAGGLDGDQFRIQSSLLRDAYPIVADASGVLGARAVELEEVDQARGRACPGKAAQAMHRLPHCQDQRLLGDPVDAWAEIVDDPERGS